MPLKIQLRKNQKAIVNGAVIENVAPRTVSLMIRNEAAILRDSEILTPEDAITPASRVYYALQCVYIFPSERKQHLESFHGYLAAYQKAAPSSQNIVETVLENVEKDHLYQALKAAKDLIYHERDIISNVQKELDRGLLDDATAGELPGD